MGLLSIFKRQTPEEFYGSFAHDIVLSALAYQAQIEGASAGESVLVGAEWCWYLLHWVDRCAFVELGEEGRDIVFDNVAARTINEYTQLFIDDYEKQDSVGDAFNDTLGKRQVIYGKCKVNEAARAGSMEYGGLLAIEWRFYTRCQHRFCTSRRQG